jgi:hypothetical protein
LQRPTIGRQATRAHLGAAGMGVGMKVAMFATVRVLIAAGAIALLTAGAYAQEAGGVGDGFGGFGGHRGKQQKTKKTEAPKPKVDEKAYSAALKELPDKQYDAWHGVR